MSKWYSVKNKPMPMDSFLIVYASGFQYLGIYHGHKNDFETVGSTRGKVPYEITHWRRLPKPPTEIGKHIIFSKRKQLAQLALKWCAEKSTEKFTIQQNAFGIVTALDAMGFLKYNDLPNVPHCTCDETPCICPF
jgi:hypothetical protein